MNTDTDTVCVSLYKGFIILIQHAPDDFTVRYGVQVDSHLTYARAAAKLGEAIMHNAACDGQLDNREAWEMGE